MNGAALLEIMEGIEMLDADPVAKRKFSDLVRGIGAAHGCMHVERAERVDFALSLLTRRVSRPTVRDRLIATFGISRPHAYRIINAALQLSQKSVRNETDVVSNNHTE
jgi:hypothetical protein